VHSINWRVQLKRKCYIAFETKNNIYFKMSFLLKWHSFSNKRSN